MQASLHYPLIDIHCHLLPGLDDGASSWSEAFSMAEEAVAQGVQTVVVTPHQLGNFSQNRGDAIRQATCKLAHSLQQRRIPLKVLPGADVRIEEDLVSKLQTGEVLTLADRYRHVLLELPHELYFHLQPMLWQLREAGIDTILSHPERNQGLLARPHLLGQLVDAGCLMQITAASITGSFGKASQRLCDWMLAQGLVHFVASDAHGAQSRRLLMKPAFEHVVQSVGLQTAVDLFSRNPARVAAGQRVPGGRRTVPKSRFLGWLARAKSGFCAVIAVAS